MEVRELSPGGDLSQNSPTKIHLLNVNNRNTRKRCGKCLKLTIKTPERSH